MISIYVNYFSRAKTVESAILKPIQVGSAVSSSNLGILRDDAGENISNLNSAYCELTGVYWAWKNDKASSYLGFMQYRRFFDFRAEMSRNVTPEGLIIYPRIDSSFIDEFGLDDETIEGLVTQSDMIIPEPLDVRNVGASSVRQQYQFAPHHHIEDLDQAGKILSSKCPDYFPYFNKMMYGHLLYPTNMFIFSRPLFERYCEWLFPILEELNENLNYAGRNMQEARAVGYIAERLFTVFVLAERERNPELKSRQLRRVFLLDTAPDPETPKLPATSLPIVTIVASCDSAYVPHLGALLASVIENVSSDVFLDFVVLDGGVSNQQQAMLRKVVGVAENRSVSFVDMRHQYSGLQVHDYFSRATFYRLSLPGLLGNRDRAIFLDTDMVAVDDVSKLYEVDLEGALIAAVPDFVIRAFSNMGVRSIESSGGMATKDYIANRLEMRDSGRPSEKSYFQAGTLVMDLKGLRESRLLDHAAQDLATQVFWFLDQDVLNKHLFGKVKYLDGRWNVCWMDEVHASSLDDNDRTSWAESMMAPSIVHYAGIGKPWKNSLNPLSHYYWQYLRSTPWYETMLFEFLDNRYAGRSGPLRSERDLGWKRVARSVMSKAWRMLPNKIRMRFRPLANSLKQKLESS